MKDDYSIVQGEEIVEIFHIENNMEEQEKYFTIEKTNSHYSIHMVSRGKKRLLMESEDERYIIACLVVLCFKNFEHPNNDPKTIRQIRTLAESGDEAGAEEIIAQSIGRQFYSINQELHNKVNLLYEGSATTVKYEEIVLIEKAKISRGYVALYNYANLLMHFQVIFEYINQVIDVENDYNELAKQYVM